MLKLGDLVEVGGVVFIALEDHERSLADAKALAEVEGDTAHEEGRVELCEVEQMSDHRGGRGFAVGAGEDHGMLILKEEGTERAWKARVDKASVANGLCLRVVATDHVTDDDQVGLMIEVGCFVALHQLNAERFKLGRHRRINACIRAGHSIPLSAEHTGKGTHGRATDPEDVDRADVAQIRQIRRIDGFAHTHLRSLRRYRPLASSSLLEHGVRRPRPQTPRALRP